MKDLKAPFWSRFYVLLHFIAAIGLIVHFTTKNEVLLTLAVFTYLVIGIISMDTDRRAEKEYRRNAARMHAESNEDRSSLLKTDGEHLHDAQRAMNFDGWNTENHTQPPAIEGTRHEQ